MSASQKIANVTASVSAFHHAGFVGFDLDAFVSVMARLQQDVAALENATVPAQSRNKTPCFSVIMGGAVEFNGTIKPRPTAEAVPVSMDAPEGGAA